jgi:hypothetical protein
MHGAGMSIELGSYVHDVLEWTERHAGLGGWVGAAGAVIAIFVTWGLARAEYLRTRRQERARRLAEIDLLTRIVTTFESQIQRYKDLGQDDPEAAGFNNSHMNDPEWHSMRDLAFMPVTSWPTLETYAEFKRYWFASTNFTQMAGITNANKAELYDQWRRAHDESFSKLMTLLRSARSG